MADAKTREQAHRDAAESILRDLVKEDLLYQHHGNVCAREEAFERLARYYAPSDVAREACAELTRARHKFGKFASAHEGYAVLREEVDELWDEVKRNGSKERMRAEAIQVAAMALRFVEDLCEEDRRD